MTGIDEASSWGRNREVSIDIEGSNLGWIDFIINAADVAGGVQDDRRIHRVSPLLKDDKDCEKYFRPMVVAVGPYHHHDDRLQEAQELKPVIAKDFLKGLDIHRVFTEFADEMKTEKIQEYYDRKHMEDKDIDQFVQMIFLDGCFVLHCMDRYKEPDFVHKKIVLSRAFVMQDLLLMENQLPFAVLSFLIERFSGQEQENKLRNIHETIRLASVMKPSAKTRDNANSRKLPGVQSQRRPHHLLDLLRKQHFSSELEADSADDTSRFGSVYECFTYRRVQELKEVGIRFRPSSGSSLGDISFEPHIFHGSLFLPPITIDDLTKQKLLNLIAYEMSPGGPRDPKVTSYICFLDMLIDRAEDVKELRSVGILNNHLASDEDVAELFNSIVKNLVPNLDTHHHTKTAIQKHCSDITKTWMTQVINQHFSSPWTVVGFIGAVFTILVTVGQTYFTIFPREKHDSGSSGAKEPRRSPKKST